MFALIFLIGHFVGDYFLQFNVWAINKFKWTSKGWTYCIIHSFVYSLIFSLAILIYAMINNISFDFMLFTLMIFMTHFPIDKTSAGKYVMKAMGRRMDHTIITRHTINEMIVSWIVYIVIDNTMHFILMLAGIKLFFPELIP